jgi:hypothetical protein
MEVLAADARAVDVRVADLVALEEPLLEEALQRRLDGVERDAAALAERGVVAPDFDARDVPTWRARLETLGPFVRAAVSEAP